MANNLLSTVLLTFCLLVVTCSACDTNDTTGIKGMFIFGDDVADPGNNNHLITLYMKANFLPYGIDFPNGPSGRWSNGKSLVDCVADNLGLPYPPPFPLINEQGVNIIQGVNFASSGVGLFGTTDMFTIGGIQHMPEQMGRFKALILPQLKKQLNCKGTAILPQYLFVIAAGNNDYSSWWILKQFLIVNPQTMASMMVNHMSNNIKTLYEVGARKFLLVSTFPIGCNPGIVKERTHCVEYLNTAIDIYYQELLIMVEHLQQQEMPDTEFSVLNSGQIIRDIYSRNTLSGIDVVDCACCEVVFGDICKAAGKTCLNRQQYLYFDGFHLTQAANCFMANLALFSNNNKYVAPSNVKKILSTPVHNLRVVTAPLPRSPEEEPPKPPKGSEPPLPNPPKGNEPPAPKPPKGN